MEDFSRGEAEADLSLAHSSYNGHPHQQQQQQSGYTQQPLEQGSWQPPGSVTTQGYYPAHAQVCL